MLKDSAFPSTFLQQTQLLIQQNLQLKNDNHQLSQTIFDFQCEIKESMRVNQMLNSQIVMLQQQQQQIIDNQSKERQYVLKCESKIKELTSANEEWYQYYQMIQQSVATKLDPYKQKVAQLEVITQKQKEELQKCKSIVETGEMVIKISDYSKIQEQLQQLISQNAKLSNQIVDIQQDSGNKNIIEQQNFEIADLKRLNSALEQQIIQSQNLLKDEQTVNKSLRDQLKTKQTQISTLNVLPQQNYETTLPRVNVVNHTSNISSQNMDQTPRVQFKLAMFEENQNNNQSSNSIVKEDIEPDLVHQEHSPKQETNCDVEDELITPVQQLIDEIIIHSSEAIVLQQDLIDNNKDNNQIIQDVIISNTEMQNQELNLIPNSLSDQKSITPEIVDNMVVNEQKFEGILPVESLTSAANNIIQTNVEQQVQPSVVMPIGNTSDQGIVQQQNNMLDTCQVEANSNIVVNDNIEDISLQEDLNRCQPIALKPENDFFNLTEGQIEQESKQLDFSNASPVVVVSVDPFIIDAPVKQQIISKQIESDPFNIVSPVKIGSNLFDFGDNTKDDNDPFAAPKTEVYQDDFGF